MSGLVRYRAADARGRVISGSLSAADPNEAKRRLRQRGLEPIRLSAEDELSSGSRRVSHRQWTMFFRSLASLVEAGMPLDRALGVSQALTGPELEEGIGEIRRAVQRGATLADGLAGMQTAPPAVVLGMIRAGERGGQLGSTLQAVADHLEREAELIGRVKQALAYPILLTVVGTGTILVIGAVILPRFAALIQDAGQALPFATRLLLGGSRLLTHAGWWLLAGFAMCVAGAHEWWSRPGGRRRLDRWVVTMPRVGPLLERFSGARVARALAGMLQAGMPLLPALDGAGLASGNTELEARLHRARDRVARGEPLAGALRREEALPGALIPLIGLGEQTGQLARMARRAGDLAAREAERTLAALVGILEPVLILAFGGLVAFVAAALLQAVYSLRPGG